MSRTGKIIANAIFGVLLSLFVMHIAYAGCLESDNGMNYYLKGSTNISRNIYSYCVFEDKCYNTKILKEYYCYNGNIRYIYFNCGTSGCSNGACTGTPQSLCTPGAAQAGTCNVCNAAGTAYLNKCTANQICSNGNCVNTQQCTPGATQTGNLCSICNSAGNGYQAKCVSPQTCNPTTGQCGAAQICTPGTVQNATACKVCNSAGTAYVPTNSKCATGQTCDNEGECQKFCIPGNIQQGTVCIACNSIGSAFTPNNSLCGAGQTCNSAGSCIVSQTCSPGTTKAGTTCLTCNAQGTGYFQDANKCSAAQTCTVAGACQIAQICAPNSVQPGNLCSVCNITGTAYVPKCSSTQTCNAATGVCTIASTASIKFASAADIDTNVYDLILSWNPDFIILPGDEFVIPSYSNGPALKSAFGSYMRPTGVSSATTNFYPSIGNHDTDNAGSTGTYVQYLAYFDYLKYQDTPSGTSAGTYYDFVRGPVHFFVINADPYVPDGTTSTSKQAQWIQSKMLSATEPWKIVYFHQPPYTSCNSDPICHLPRTDMRWPFKAWGADAVLNGHQHNYERLLEDGVVYFVNGLGGQTTYEFTSPPAVGSQLRYNSDYGAQLITADSHTLTFKFITVSGQTIDTYTLTK